MLVKTTPIGLTPSLNRSKLAEETLLKPEPCRQTLQADLQSDHDIFFMLLK